MDMIREAFALLRSAKVFPQIKSLRIFAGHVSATGEELRHVHNNVFPLRGQSQYWLLARSS